MLKKLMITTALAVSMAVTPALAEFYKKDIGQWEVFGVEKEGNKNKACVVSFLSRDGSAFQLIKDLDDGELYIWIRNHAWDIQQESDEYDGMVVIIEGDDNYVKSWPATYLLINKNTVAIRNINNALDFIVDFSKHKLLKIIMPDNISNIYLDLADSGKAMEALYECVKSDPAKNKKDNSSI